MKRVAILILAIIAVLTTAIWFGTAQRAEAHTVHHSESSDGDLSAEPLSPAFVMVSGVNTWSGAIEPTSSKSG